MTVIHLRCWALFLKSRKYEIKLNGDYAYVQKVAAHESVSEGKRLLAKLWQMESGGVSAGALTVCVAELKQRTTE